MKDRRHEHPLNDPEHQRTCERCRTMDVLGASFQEWLTKLHDEHLVADEPLVSFLLLYLANVTLDVAALAGEGAIQEEQLPALREAFVREAGQAFDAAVTDMRVEQGA